MTAKISGMVSPFLLPPGFMGMVRSFSASADGKWAADPLGRDVDRITRGRAPYRRQPGGKVRPIFASSCHSFVSAQNTDPPAPLQTW